MKKLTLISSLLFTSIFVFSAVTAADEQKSSSEMTVVSESTKIEDTQGKTTDASAPTESAQSEKAGNSDNDSDNNKSSASAIGEKSSNETSNEKSEQGEAKAQEKGSKAQKGEDDEPDCD